MIYDILLRITYAYGNPAAAGRQLLRLMPTDLPGTQRLVAGHLEISPRPLERRDGVDFFGNTMVGFSLRQPHSRIALRVQARVDRRPAAFRLGDSTPLPALATELAAVRDMGPASPVHFTAASPRAPRHTAMAAYASDRLRPGMTAAEAVLAVGGALHRDMVYDPEATQVDTPAAEAFAGRHGVCQDFSHIMITCLRSAGIPAGYVSGFLRTSPPPGKPRLEGADAMHAWVRAWCGRTLGWIEYDPTNGVLAGEDHVVVARGRDYFDVAPVKGVLRVSGRQRSDQAVDMIPLTEADAIASGD